MDIEHFQIIVNAMLSWQAETPAPKKLPSRHVAAAAPRDELDDDEEYVDEETFEPEESLNMQPEAAEADTVDVDIDAAADLLE